MTDHVNGPTPRLRAEAVSVRALGLVAALCVWIAIAMAPSCGGGGGSPGGGTDEGVPDTRRERLTLLLEDLGNRVIVPSYASMADSFTALEGSASQFCAAPSSSTLDGLRQAWRASMRAWLVAGTTQFGPIHDDNRRLRIEFWPDPNNNVRRSVQQVLARSDALDATSLAGQSVAGQGLPALEMLIFDPDRDVLASFTIDAGAARRCQYAVAIAGNLHRIAEEIVREWRRTEGGFVDQLTTAGSGSDTFATRDAAIEEVVNSLVTMVEVTKNNRLGDPLGGATVADAKPFRAESYLSGSSLDNVSSAVEGLLLVYTSDGDHFGFDDYLRSLDRFRLNGEITDAFDSVERLAAAVPVPLTEAVQDEAQRTNVVQLFDAATLLTQLLKNQLSEVMQVTVGFNENDGD